MTSRRSVASKILTSTTSIMAMLAAGAIISPTQAFALDAGALPENGTVVGGGATFDYSQPNNLNVNQSTDRVVINWDGFNIGADATTRFYQPGSNSLAVNRVLAKGTDPTQILGHLIANGKVMVLDRNGVIFGRDSVIDVGGIIASTGDINTDQIMSGSNRLDIGNLGDGEIVNNGTITVADAGLVGFVGKTAINNGVINAKLGRVSLASGEKATVDLYGDGLIEIAADSNLEKAIVSNTGTINAEGGSVQLTASAAKSAVDNVVNMSGIVDVSSVEVKGGKIILGGNGTTKVSGKLLANGKTGGGKIEVKGKDITVTKDALLMADALETGNGGDVKVLADNDGIFEGDVYARGGSVSGNGGSVEISAKGQLGYDGSVETTAANGEAGSLLFDPLFAIIHSGTLNNPLGFQYILSAEALANDLARNGSLTVQADNYIDVGTNLSGLGIGDGPINLANYNYNSLEVTGHLFGFPIYGLVNHHGITSGNVLLQSDTINFNKDVTLGSGNLTALADTINLNSKIYGYDAAKTSTSLLADDRLIGDPSVATINVLSSAALINQAIAFSDDASALTTINVYDGTYTENVSVNKSNVKLQSKNGRDATKIVGTANAGAEATVQIENGANSVQLGDTGKGFTIVGFDNGTPGSETAAVYLRGSQDKTTIKGNRITANGDEALLAQYGFAHDHLTIDGNIFDGQTFTGADNSWGVGGDQFVTPNTPRQLVALNNGVQHVVFTNNDVVGNSGNRQLVAIESPNAVISGNHFDGLTTASALRVRGAGINVSGNTIDGNGRGVGIESDQNAVNLTVDNNTIDNTGSDGIQIVNGSGVTTISNNKIGLTGGANNIGGDGIFIYNTDGAVITLNQTKDTKYSNTGPLIKGSGITVSNSDNVVVSDNTIQNGGNDGITVRKDGGSADNVDVLGNHINTTDRVGIYLEGATNSEIRNNDITKNGRYAAIYLAGGGNFWVTGNDIDHVAEAGILAQNTSGAFTIIDNNSIDFTGEGKKSSDGTNSGDGIMAVNATGLVATNNKIGLNGAVNGNGIFVDPSNGAYIAANKIKGVSANGIYSLNNDDVTIQQNEITNAALNGILVEGGSRTTVGGPSAGYKNTITNSGLSGVKVVNANDTNVSNNVLTGGSVGVDLVNGSDITVSANKIDGGSTATAGIRASDVAGLTIGGATAALGNTIHDIVSGYNSRGIDLANGSDITVSHNTLTNVGGLGIAAVGDYFAPATKLDITDNTITNSEYDAINLFKWNGAQITGNTIAGSTYGSGVNLALTNGTKVLNNTISNAAASGVGLYYGNDGTIIQGNTLTSNKYGIQLETAGGQANTNTLIGFGVLDDPAAKANTITGGTTGILVNGGGNLRVAGNIISGNSDAGIDVKNSGGAFNIFTFNKVNSTGSDGIRLAGTIGSISDNRVGLLGAIGGNGIFTTGGDTTEILANQVSNTAKDGIKVEGGDHIKVQSNNQVKNAGRVGIYAANSTNLLIDGNSVNGATYAIGSPYGGITTDWGSDITISNNTVTDAGHGVMMYLTQGTNKVSGNKIDNVKYDGISINQVAGLTIDSNKIGQAAGLIGRHGISIDSSNGTQVTSNDVAQTAQAGIKVYHGVDANISGNHLKHIGNQGIWTDQVATLDVKGNDLTDVSWSGVQIEGGSNVTVAKNTLSDIRGNGIQVSGSNTADIRNNDVSGIRLSGIVLNDAKATSTIEGNVVHDTGVDAISAARDEALKVLKNFVGYTDKTVPTVGTAGNVKGNGIAIVDSNGAIVTNNKVNQTVGNGIFVDPSVGTVVADNTINNAGANGVYILNSDDSRVQGNTIGNSGLSGIRVEGSSNVKVGGSVANGNTINGTTVGWQNNGISIIGGADNLVRNNTVNNAGSHGIMTDGSFSVEVADNKINDAKNSGIQFYHSDEANIHDNVVLGADYGIAGETSADVKITDNKIGSALNRVLRNGIDLWYGVSGAKVAGNTIFAKENGISLGNAGGQFNDDATITNNTIDGGTNGIILDGGDNAKIAKNKITGASVDGIHVAGGSNLTIGGVNDSFANIIKTSGDDGIDVSGTTGTVSVAHNKINGTSNAGIELTNLTGAVINNNVIKNANYDGIGTYGGSGLLIEKNIIKKAGASGVSVHQTAGTTVNDNKITDTNYLGVYGQGTDGIKITNNTVKNTGLAVAQGDKYGHGIGVESANGVTIAGNTVKNAKSSGISVGQTINNGVADSSNVVIRNNTVKTSGADGITVANSDSVKVRKNKIVDADLYGVRVLNATGVTLIGHNRIDDVNEGIHTEGTVDLRINGNKIGKNGPVVNGINVANSLLTSVLNNMISNATSNGILLSLGTGSASVAGNEVTDSDVGMNFESGLIDLTGASNTMTGGRVGYRFAPTGVDSVNLVGNTIGTSIFSGQSQYYIELANGALYNPGTPTVIDGLSASYDGFVPNSVGGILTQAQYDNLETRIFHFNDDPTLGLFFFGLVPGIDQNDIFRDIAGIPGQAGRFSITIRALPNLPGQIQTAANGNRTFSLNDITPAAGGDETVNPANIEPSAGGDESTTPAAAAGVNCWGDAAASASAGQSATYSFGGGADALSAGACTSNPS